MVLNTPSSRSCASNISGFTFTPSFIFSPKPRQRRVHAAIEEPDKVAWDPEGLFASVPTATGLFARKERDRAALSTPGSPEQPLNGVPPSLPPSSNIRPLPPSADATEDGIPANATSSYDAKTFLRHMNDRYMPLDMNFPGLRILHLDPPVVIVDEFFTPEQCDRLIAAAKASGKMVSSKVGAGNVQDIASAVSMRRTSTSMLVDRKAQSESAELASLAKELQQRGLDLFGGASTGVWAPPGTLPRPKQYCYEALQVAEYQPGQYFMAHEDAFPMPLARDNRFQRHATLLVYLTDCEEGGATTFEHLGLAVKPRKGRALLFFPAFADGTPDARTLHTATPAVDLKWVTQQWIARGLGVELGGGVGQTMSVAGSGATSESAEELLKLRNKRRGKDASSQQKRKNAGGKKGFGFG